MSKKPTVPICPKCGAQAIRQTTRYGDRYACCGLWAWGKHPLADAATHAARNAAHAAFDPLWKTGIMNRSFAYAKLAEGLGIDARDCHMKLMGAEMARRVPAIAQRLRAEMADQ